MFVFFQLHTREEFICRQSLCLCLDFQIFSSATSISGDWFTFSLMPFLVIHLSDEICWIKGRVLSYGIAGAVIFRAIMILLGAATLQVCMDVTRISLFNA